MKVFLLPLYNEPTLLLQKLIMYFNYVCILHNYWFNRTWYPTITLPLNNHFLYFQVWDLNDMICIRNYSLAHSASVADVSVRPNSTTSFASGSLDMYVTLWDDNIDKPVLGN